MKRLIWIIPIVYVALVGQQIFRSFVKIDRLRIDKENRTKEKKILEKEIAEYSDMIKNMNEPYYREKIARDRLQMVLPDEKIYRLIEE